MEFAKQAIQEEEA